MSEFVNINGTTVAFAIAWLPYADSKRAASAFAKKRRSNYKIAIPHGKRFSYGFARYPGYARSKTQVISAAVQFSNWAADYARKNAPESGDINRDFLLVVKIPNSEKYGFIVVKHNEIYRDVIITKSEIVKSVSDIEAETGTTFEVFSDSKDVFATAISFDLAAMISFDKKKSTMARMSTLNFGTVALFTLVLGSIAGSITYYVIDQENRESEVALPEIDPAVQYRNSLLPKLRQSGYTGQAALSQIWATIGNIEIDNQGWDLSRIDCDLKKCKQTWKRGNGTSADFAATHTNGTLYFVNDDQAEYSTPVKAVLSAISEKDLPEQAKFKLEYVSLNQSLQKVSSFANIKIVLDKIQPFAIPPGVDAKRIPAEQLVYKGKIQYTMPDAFVYDALSHMPSNVAITRIDLQIAAKAAKATISGEYYVKQ